MKYSQLYWLAFLLMATVRGVFRYYPQYIPAQDPELISTEQMIFSLYATLVYLFCIFATYKMFRSKGVSIVASAINGVISIFYWAIIMIIQMIYIFNKQAIEKSPEGES